MKRSKDICFLVTKRLIPSFSFLRTFHFIKNMENVIYVYLKNIFQNLGVKEVNVQCEFYKIGKGTYSKWQSRTEHNSRDLNHLNLSQLQKFDQLHYVWVLCICHSLWSPRILFGTFPEQDNLLRLLSKRTCKTLVTWNSACLKMLFRPFLQYTAC